MQVQDTQKQTIANYCKPGDLPEAFGFFFEAAGL